MVVLPRSASPLTAIGLGLAVRDVGVEAGQGALIKMQFRDFNGRYLIHCHNMAHEDNFMMVRWDICPDQASLDACIADQQVCELEMKANARGFRGSIVRLFLLCA